ncbi:ABC transporter ATP-binding protein [Luteipulveratus halotolerans]|uniref:Multidrug ABC transporter ATPase n=1 Tax=Luteipulveratus halotolerans TaxID=1631356 RepID=A0A0L6CET0_9MICO|nr:ABC transporter ATP-binding protein [Luteipulveratus halotolerans]KNX35998.1 multidrug ABC transporter ATPase [Luteipulveratus halotolerans]
MLVKLLRERLQAYGGWLAALIALQLVSVAASLYLPSLNAAIIDKGLSRGDTDYIWHTGLIMLAVSFVQVLAAGAATYVGAFTATGFGRDVRAAIFRTVGRFSGREVNEFGAPSLITRSTNDVQQVQMLVLMGCNMVVAAPIMMAGGVVMALREDVGLSWLMVVAVPVLAIAIGLIVSRMVPGFRSMQKKLDEVNRVLREQLMGVRVIRAFVREPYETSRFTGANAELTEVSRRVMRLMGAMFPIVMLVMNASTVAVLWFGGHRVGSGDMQVGSLTAYMTYLIQILMSVMMATFMVMMIPRASVSSERIQGVLDTESSVVPPREPVRVEQVRGVVELDHVSMRYPGADVPVLRDVSLRAEPGQTVAVIGSTGSGKTTLISLVARLFDATDGRVTIDGVDVRELDPEMLWGHLGIVPQKPYLFSGTVASNLRYGNPSATDEEIWEALEVAQAKDFVAKMDGGLEATIAQGGTNVSGGQRQRLCIARAIVARPSIYLFDDSFSALDLATDARLRGALAPYTRDATVFLVAQRVSTITGADRIIVLDDGLVVGSGTHDELLDTCETYQEIVESQAAQESAA